ncbi:hypothetical protein TWF718_005950 [Orbilia javanica]|uniref:Uncharacterized protein n=1 Tax=Orbilia javanica TaxID=47235 RepID=A0AAN8N2D3_9PEZI
MGWLSSASILVLGIGLHIPFAIAAPFLGTWNDQIDSISPTTPITTQVTFGHRGILTVLDLPILIPSIPPPSTPAVTRTKLFANQEPLKVTASIHGSSPSQPPSPSSSSILSSETPFSTSRPRPHPTQTTLETTTLTLTRTEKKLVTSLETTSLVPAHVPVQYVYNLPRSAGSPHRVVSRRRIKPRVYVTETIFSTVRAPDYIVTLTTSVQIVTKTTSVDRPGPPKTVTLTITPTRGSTRASYTTRLPRTTVSSTLKSKSGNTKSTRPPPASSTPTRQGHLKCNGLFRYQTDETTGEKYRAYYYFDYDLALPHVNDYCQSLRNLPDNHTKDGIQRSQIGNAGDLNSFNLGVYWPSDLPGTKPQAEICIHYFKAILLDGCDGNDPKNPLNWKGGGTIYAVD